MTQFEATKEQILQMAVNAVNASAPMGLGMLHFVPKNYTVEDVKNCLEIRGLHIDYFEGRMVKLHIFHEDDGSWRGSDPRADYQSWANTYPTFKALVDSVGAKELVV